MAPSWSIRDKTVLITGGNSGIGREAAATLAAQGAVVVFTSRDLEKGQAALEYARARSGTDRVTVMELDLASFASIRSFASGFLESHDQLHVLINNAGAILTDRAETAEGFEMTFGVNHLGHFLLTDLLLDRIRLSAPARIINVSSIAHRFAGGVSTTSVEGGGSYRGVTAYNESKLANVLFTQELARRLEGTGVTVNACHPGPVRTGFGSADDTTGFQRIGLLLGKPFMIGPRRGSIPLVELAVAPELADTTGQYFSRWPWSALPFAAVKPHRTSRGARRPGAAAELWTESERLVEKADA